MKSDNFPEKYRNDIQNAKNLLKNEGCGSVFVFGSLVTGKYNDNSDIDIGIPASILLNFSESMDNYFKSLTHHLI